ncbi:MAG: tetratricopeptide repeat protein [Candidatus Omnitrophota bacterium]|nr:tetratricopeptide repeat protein [Candidatus Omnitrophota bacterium]
MNLSAGKSRGIALALPVLIVFGFVLYSNTFHASFNFDDSVFISENLAIRDIGRLGSIWETHKTRFLPFLSFALNYHFHQLDVTGYHLVNISIHILTSYLVFLIMLSTCRTPALKDDPLVEHRVLLAAAGALIFLCHPVQTQAVTYISQRMASMACCFYFATLYFYIRFRLDKDSRFLIPAGLCAVLAVLSKQNTFTLPLALLLYDVCFWGIGTRGLWRKRCALLLFVLPLVMAYFLFFAAKDIQSATRMLTAIPRHYYLFTQFSVICTYIRLLFLPVNQSVDYDYAISTSFFEPVTLISFLFLCSLAGLALRLYKKEPLIAFGVFWFFLTLSIESSIIPINDVIFEHRLYLPSLGFAMILPWCLHRLIKNKRRALIALLILIAVLSGMTYRRNAVWADGFSLWEDAIEKAPGKARPYHNLGFHYAENGNWEKAIAACLEAIKRDPNHAAAYVTLGRAYGQMGNYDMEIESFQKAIEVSPEPRPKHFNNLGAAYGRRGEYEKAIETFKKGIEQIPNYAPLYNNLGFAYDQVGGYDRALISYEQALELDPKFAEAYNHRGITYGKIGELDKAIENCMRAVQLKPDFADAYNNLGVAYQQKGEKDKAIESYKKALATDPKYTRAQDNLSKLL